MKFLVLALALVSAASAAYITPFATGYSGYGWGHDLVAPAISAYSAPAYVSPAYSPFVKNVIAAPAYGGYGTYGAYGTAAPILPAYHAPAVTTYAAAPVVSHYGIAAPTFYGNTWGGDAFGLDLWKKKKAAAH